jgi:phosphopantothenoylcysteine decarboxylase/phosphopantothenate--cysteine ligase
MPEPLAVFEETLRLLSPQDLSGETVLVTAGPTREELDPVRYLSNYSSGKMGYAIARAACQRGARVILVSGPTALPVPSRVELVPVVSARQMREAVMARLPEATVVVKSAAVADYRPSKRSEQKIKKGQEAELKLTLEKNPDILAELGQRKTTQLLVGFAAETTDLLENARKKLETKNLDLIVANDVSRSDAGFNVDTNAVRLLYRDGSSEELPLLSKDEVAQQLLDRIGRLRHPLT